MAELVDNMARRMFHLDHIEIARQLWRLRDDIIADVIKANPYP